MSSNNYLVKDYEHKSSGRILCKNHGLLRCSECAYVDDLEKESKRYREALLKIRYDETVNLLDDTDNIIDEALGG